MGVVACRRDRPAVPVPPVAVGRLAEVVAQPERRLVGAGEGLEDVEVCPRGRRTRFWKVPVPLLRNTLRPSFR
jgi:hypothetical protein